MLEKQILLVFIFMCFGLSTEIFFTALTTFISKWRSKEKLPWDLTGKTYVWMVFIYGSIPLLFASFFPYISEFPLFIRLCVYLFCIYIIEFISGFLLEKILGACPWEYKTGMHIKGFVRLDYAPAWLFFGFLIERLYIYLNSIL